MELTYDEYLKLHSKNIILVMNNSEEKKGVIRGMREKEGKISFLLLHQDVIQAIPLNNVSKVISE